MSERRKLKRRHLIYRLQVFDRSNDQLLGHLVDVTTEGIMVMSEDPIDTDATFRLRMALPAAIEGSKPILFEAKSVWSRSNAVPGYYDTGFQMVHIDPEHMGEIKRLITEYGFRD